MKSFIIFSLLLLSGFIFSSLVIDEQANIELDDVATLLHKLGERSTHKAEESEKVSAEKGYELFHYGITKNKKGKKTKKQSKHFVCSSCHNTEREDPDLKSTDPQARLEYVTEKGLPFLQGTTLWGAVNRTSFYNGDYEKKYGDLVVKARNNIREAIQLCAVECSQGRRLKRWEKESILAYLWTLQMKSSDLGLSAAETKSIQSALDGKSDKAAAIQLIKSKYLQGAPAHFSKPPEDRKTGYSHQGNPDNGKLIFDASCMHCHENGRYSHFRLDESRLSFKHLNKHFPKYSRYSIYQVARYGTPPMNGKRAYMPQYTSEKMSDQQMEDLRAYIKKKSN